MRLRLLALALALLVPALLAGCAAPPGGLVQRNNDGACSTAASWREPGLHALLPDAARVPDVLVEPTTPHSPLLGFEHPDLEARGNASVTFVEWDPADGGPRVWLRGMMPGEVDVTVHAGFGDARLLPVFGAFLDAVGLADSPERPAWERALAGSPRDRWPPHATFVAEPDLAPLHERMRANLTEELNGPGTVFLRSGEWSLGLFVPGWLVTTDDVRLTVDGIDQVGAYATLEPGEPAWPGVQQRARAAFERMGVPPPAFQDVRDMPRHGC